MSGRKEELLALARDGDKAALEEKFLAAVTAAPDDLDTYLEVGEKLRSSRRLSEAETLLSMLIEPLEKSGPEDRSRLMRFLATCAPKERTYRSGLVRALTEMNSERPVFELFVEASDLKGEGPLDEALEELDRLSAYDVGNYVYHGSGWGVGKIEDVDSMSQELVIRFEGGRKHQLPVRSAVEILKTIPDDDWRVQRTFQREAFLELCEKSPGEVIANILKQANRSLDTTSFKELLAGSVIPKDRWSKWWSSARRNAMKRSDVAQDGKGNKLVFVEVDHDDPFEPMKSAMTAVQVIEFAESYLKNLPDADADNNERFQEFSGLLITGSEKHAPKNDASPLELLLLADELIEERKLDPGNLEDHLASYFADDKRILRHLVRLKTQRRSKRALAHLKNRRGEEYARLLMEMVPDSASLLLEQIVTEAMDQGQVEPLKTLCEKALKRPEQLPDLLVWSRKRCTDPKFAPVLGHMDPKVLLQRALGLGETKGKTLDPYLRKLSRQVAQDLGANKGKELRKLITKLKKNEAMLLRSYVAHLRGLSDNARMVLVDVFDDVHGGPAVEAEELPEVFYPEDVIFCTQEGIDKRNEEYEHLVNIKLPAIFDAIGKAAAHGDLSENAEYTAALEERAAMTRKAEDIKNELKAAKPISNNLLQDGLVTIGTKVQVTDHNAGKQETYTLLGPWDADFEQGILDYRAPLADALLGHKVGDVIETNIGGTDRKFEVQAIESVI